MYNFLATAGAKYGVGFWKPGSGIIHQVKCVYAFAIFEHAVGLLPYGEERAQVQTRREFHQLRETTCFP